MKSSAGITRPRHVLAIDQGTTSTRSIIFDERGRSTALARRELVQHYPADGWVEHDVEDFWRDALATAREALERAGLAAKDIAAIGITNQRETTVVWDRASGQPVSAFGRKGYSAGEMQLSNMAIDNKGDLIIGSMNRGVQLYRAVGKD